MHCEVFFLEALKELGSPAITEEALGQARTVLKAALEMYQAMGEGAYGFSASWTTPETFEAAWVTTDLSFSMRTLSFELGCLLAVEELIC